MIKVYIADTSPLTDGDVFFNNYNKMSAYRRDKIDRYKNDSDKRLSLGAGILLNMAFTDIGRPDLTEQITVKDNGRPFVNSGSGIDFNLSHSGQMAMCVIADHAVGCDIQQMKDTDGKVAMRCFSDAEREYVFAVRDEKEICRRFYRIWVMKEAYTKLTGEGISRDFRSFNVLETENMFRERSFDDYMLCVAGTDENEEIEWKTAKPCQRSMCIP